MRQQQRTHGQSQVVLNADMDHCIRAVPYGNSPSTDLQKEPGPSRNTPQAQPSNKTMFESYLNILDQLCNDEDDKAAVNVSEVNAEQE